ncbi:MAG: hypothetical protein AAFY50_05330 [Cyanobacteria bacterium J06648_1]
MISPIDYAVSRMQIKKNSQKWSAKMVGEKINKIVSVVIALKD